MNQYRNHCVGLNNIFHCCHLSENKILQISENKKIKICTLPLVDFKGVVSCVAFFRMQRNFTHHTKILFVCWYSFWDILQCLVRYLTLLVKGIGMSLWSFIFLSTWHSKFFLDACLVGMEMASWQEDKIMSVIMDQYLTDVCYVAEKCFLWPSLLFGSGEGVDESTLQNLKEHFLQPLYCLSSYMVICKVLIRRVYAVL